MPNQSTPVSREPRVIRVFVSSTFRDMQDERDHLVKFTFPQLRKMCEQRGVVWGEVDLRWGITDEERSEGKVLPLCLAEIRRCRPYFISLLGERYGWVPEDISPELVEQEPWLAGLRDHSVTELEILHGVLRDPQMANHAFFYLRDPAYADTLPSERRPDFRCESPDHERKLQDLKERIRRSGLPVREGYTSPHSLGDMILADMTSVIDRMFPAWSQPDPLDQEAAEHEAFARSRAAVRVDRERIAGVYIGRDEYFRRLDAHAEGSGSPLVVLGESGSGKSALLANWALNLRARPIDASVKPPAWHDRLTRALVRAPLPHELALVLMHFVGATPQSSDWSSMLRRIIGELDRRLGTSGEVAAAPDALRTAFADRLRVAAARGRVVIVLDGLDQLEDRDGAPDLTWLPLRVPANIRLVVSTLPGRSLDALRRRGCPVLEVEPLTPPERRRLIIEYLMQYSKHLSTEHVERIASAPQSSNPLYLRVLLEELRLFGQHSALEERIEHYLRSLTIQSLYERVLERWEDDYDTDECRDLVRSAMSLLWAARRGLAETELLEAMGTAGNPIPRAYWTPLLFAADQSLVSRSGLLGFFHVFLRAAVQARYVPEEAAQRSAHLRVADYFSRQDLTNRRRIDEEAWQLDRAEAWERLQAVLTDAACLRRMWALAQFDVQRYWSRLEALGARRMVEAYADVIAIPSGQPSPIAYTVFCLCFAARHLDAAMTLEQGDERWCRQNGNRAGLAAALGNQAMILQLRGDLHKAMSLYAEQEELCREDRNQGGLAACLGNQATALRKSGDLDRAMVVLHEEERICRAIRDMKGLAYSLGNQAAILMARNDLNGATLRLREMERICREQGDPIRLAYALGQEAALMHMGGDLKGALSLYQEEAGLCDEGGDISGLSTSLGKQAVILRDLDDPDGAMNLLKRQEQICREREDSGGLSAALGNQALILQDRGDLDGAMALHKEEERICREIGYTRGLAGALGNQAAIVQRRGDLDGALELRKEEERLCREEGDSEGLAYSLANQAMVHRAGGHMKEARRLIRKALSLARASGHAHLAEKINRMRDTL